MASIHPSLHITGDPRMSNKKFASQADLEEKQISWEKLSDNA